MSFNLKRNLLFVLFCSFTSFFFTGCESRNTRIKVPGVPKDLPAAILAEFDANGDGSISENELPQGFLIEAFDADGDKLITESEIAKAIEDWKVMKIGMTAFNLRFTINGLPLSNATVTLEPYAFMGNEVLPATGITDSEGVVDFSVPEGSNPVDDIDLMHCGFYRIKVSKMDGGRETIPKEYNTNTKLGCAVLPNTRSGALIELR